MLFGPGAVTGLLLVSGYLIAMGYAAWRKKDAFEVPIQDLLALFVVSAFVYLLAYILFGKVRITEGGDILIGALIAAFSAIIARYFRSKD